MIRRALRKATLAIAVTPVLLGSAFKNKGVQPLLDAVVDYLRARSTCRRCTGSTRARSTSSRAAGRGRAVLALAFKVMSDPYVGKLTYFRVYSGKIQQGDRVLNVTTGKSERIGRLLQMHANHREERGDRRWRDRRRGRPQGDDDGRHACDRDGLDPARVDELPRSVISVAIEPKTKADQDKLAGADASCRGGPHLPRPERRGDRPDDHRRDGRAPPGDHRRPPHA